MWLFNSRRAPNSLETPVLGRGLPQMALKKPAQMGGGVEAGSPGYFVYRQTALSQQRTGAVHPATDDFVAHAVIEPAPKPLFQVGARAAQMGQDILDANPISHVVANIPHRLDGDGIVDRNNVR